MSRELDIRHRAIGQLRRHSHLIVRAGYERLDPSKYSTWKEPDITGELCKAMTDFMASAEAPRWIERYALRDDPKLNVAGKFGESRPRIDIELERVQRGERPKFCFEAKRLGPKHPLSSYLGSEGMGAFISGYYPLTHGEAGMLGYIQQGLVGVWCDQLEQALVDVDAFRLAIPGLKEARLVPKLDTWSTAHVTESKNPLEIWHSLLRFW